jgi:hypothetical protein
MAVILPIITEFDGIGITRAIKQFQALETTSEKAQFAIRKASIPAAAALAGLAAAAGFAVKGALDDLAAQSALARQLKVSAQATDANVASIENYISSLGTSVAVTDDEARPAFANLALATHDLTKAQDLMTIAIDTATATSKPLADVTDAIAKAYAGNTKGLKTLSPELSKMITDGTSAAEAFKLLETNFRGAGETAAKTTAGQLAVLKIQINETKEAIGLALIPILDRVLPLIKSLGTFAQENTTFVTNFAAAVGLLSAAITAARLAIAAFKTVAVIVTAVNYALASSLVAVQIATGIGIIAVMAGVAAFAAYENKMNSTKNNAKKLAEETSALTRSTRQSVSAIENQEKQYLKIAPVISDVTKKTNTQSDAEKRSADALATKQKAIDDYLTSYKNYAESISGTITGLVSLSDAVNKVQSGESENVGAAFKKQIEDAKAFANNLKTLIAQGLGQAGLAQLLNLGPVAGLQVTDEMILGTMGIGPRSISVGSLNADLAGLQEVSAGLGGAAAGAFMGKGGGGAGVNITVNTGVGDPVAIGKGVVDALNAYRARTGSYGFAMGK